MPLSLLDANYEEQTVKTSAVEAACSRIAPLWPLQNFVAVNPFLGLSGLSFREADRVMAKVAHSRILMDAGYYLERIESGAIRADDIKAVLVQEGFLCNAPDPVSWLRDQLQGSGKSEQIRTVADSLDRRDGTDWGTFVVEEISKWCSSYFDSGESPWQGPFNNLSLYEAWREAASRDANPEMRGLPGFRCFVRDLPFSEEGAIEEALELLDVPPPLAADFLHRELMSVTGWSAYAAYKDRGNDGRSFVRQMLAIRLAWDAALFTLHPDWRCELVRANDSRGPACARYIAQLATEHCFRTKLMGKLQSPVPPPAPRSPRKLFQAIFCIDVRSEVYRRALESQSDGIETVGFAGFFGMPVKLGSSALCPVLLSPQHELREVKAGPEQPYGKLLQTVFETMRKSATACFPSVEVGGLLSGVHLVRKALALRSTSTEIQELTWSIPLSTRTDLAAGALKNMSIDTAHLAPVVLVCGHGSTTENNPYGSSLDCGACGGHKGDVNARFAAALMNDPAVRQGLRERGIAIPEDTVFVAGLHNTTTDEVSLDGGPLLSEQQRQQISGWLSAASEHARLDRSNGTRSARGKKGEAQLRAEAIRRSRDWSEVRPEWGLAGNAAFIAAPRSRTRGLDLQGRVFLHDYDSTMDADASVLGLVLTAPVVVASWINLQYYASTVNNRLFGSGNKVLHNVVGRLGVLEGNGGDLRTGLPLQSLHDGSHWVHEPLRLQVIIEAPRHRIEGVLNANPSVRQLFENGWIHLTALEGTAAYAFRGGSHWHFNREDRDEVRTEEFGARLAEEIVSDAN